MRFPKVICVTMMYYAQKGKCILCGYRLPDLSDVRHSNDWDRLSLDHLIPKKYAGKNTIWNFGVAHNRCNSERGCNPLTREQEIRIAYAQRDLLELLAVLGIFVDHPQEVLRHKSIDEAMAIGLTDEQDESIEDTDLGDDRETVVPISGALRTG